MDELVKLVVQKTGLPEAQAKQAVEIVIGFLKAKLPAPVAGQIDGLLASGAAGNLGNVGNVAQGLGGLFGKKKG